MIVCVCVWRMRHFYYSECIWREIWLYAAYIYIYMSQEFC